MPSKTLFLSVKPRFAEKLLSGEKTLELRRTRPRVERGDHVLIYASAPESRIVGYCRVGAVLSASPGLLWEHAGLLAAVTREEYDEYFQGAESAIGIQMERPAPLDEMLSLADLREFVPNFMPPQSFRYVGSLETRLRSFLGGVVEQAVLKSV